VILDPNVLVSAVMTPGVSADLLDRWLTDRPFEVMVCPILIAELRGVLVRPKFRRWITAEQAAGFVDLLEREAGPCIDRGPTRHQGPQGRRPRRSLPKLPGRPAGLLRLRPP
jgi:predicted nucleic acid-binding protein